MPAKVAEGEVPESAVKEVKAGAVDESPPSPPGESGVVEELSAQEQRTVQELQRRNREVRAHEAAHMGAGAGLVRGGATFSYQTGPDNQRYAVGGEVSIDVAPVHGDPQATIVKAERIRAAALAPADPSSQDKVVAARAARMALEARLELADERRGEFTGVKQENRSDSAIQDYVGDEPPGAGSLLDQLV